MSAPLVVNTTDGTCWTRRAVTRSGEALYAPEGVCSCPEFVMATLAELAEHGIAGSAYALPVPIGRQEPRTELEKLRAQVAELLAERHETNEALSDAAEQLRADRDRIAELEASAAVQQRRGYEAAIEVMRQERLPMSVGLLEAQLELNELDGAVPGPDGIAPTQALSDGEATVSGPVCPVCQKPGCCCSCFGKTPRTDCPHQAHREDVTPQVTKLRALLAGQRAAVEDPHDGPLTHRYALGRDLPETGGGR